MDTSPPLLNGQNSEILTGFRRKALNFYPNPCDAVCESQENAPMSRHESIVNKNIVTATTMTVTYFPHVATPVPKFHAIWQNSTSWRACGLSFVFSTRFPPTSVHVIGRSRSRWFDNYILYPA